MTVSNLSSELALLRSRIGEEFDGECHLTAEEAERIASGISSLLERNETEQFDALVKAYRTGAEDVHRYWANQLEEVAQQDRQGGPDFTEAAHTYARAALETQDRGSASHDD